MADPADWLDPDRAYMNGAFIPGADEFPAKWAADAAKFRSQTPALLDLAYGSDPRQKLDIFLPSGKPKGLLVFIHGGYWMAFDRKDFSHLAAGAVAQGWACALPSYRLAPQVGLTDMTRDLTLAVKMASSKVAGPLVVTGHSAGGQLAARIGCADGPVAVSRVVPISPLADLAPLRATQMQASLQITDAELSHESPARQTLRSQAHVWVGGQERPAFLWQARVLAEAWACDLTVSPGHHHFDVIDGLADPRSPLIRACLGGL